MPLIGSLLGLSLILRGRCRQHSYQTDRDGGGGVLHDPRHRDYRLDAPVPFGLPTPSLEVIALSSVAST